MSQDELLKLVKKYTSIGEVNWEEGKASGSVYNANKELTDVMTKVYGMTAWTNPLHPEVFPGVLAMEAEIIRMCCTLFNGGPETCGTVLTNSLFFCYTSGSFRGKSPNILEILNHTVPDIEEIDKCAPFEPIRRNIKYELDSIGTLGDITHGSLMFLVKVGVSNNV